MIKIGELRGELLSVATSKSKSSRRVTHAKIQVLGESPEAVTVLVPIEHDQYGELAEHVGRQVRVSFEVFPVKE